MFSILLLPCKREAFNITLHDHAKPNLDEVRRKTILVHKHDFEAGFHDVVSWNKDGVFAVAASNFYFF